MQALAAVTPRHGLAALHLPTEAMGIHTPVSALQLRLWCLLRLLKYSA